jgi:hypothetical protein
VEHDLSVLDYLSDFICCLYGKPGAYGVVTMPFGVRWAAAQRGVTMPAGPPPPHVDAAAAAGAHARAAGRGGPGAGPSGRGAGAVAGGAPSLLQGGI